MTMEAIVKQISRLLTGCTLTQEQANELHDQIHICTGVVKTKVLDDGKTIEGKITYREKH